MNKQTKMVVRVAVMLALLMLGIFVFSHAEAHWYHEHHTHDDAIENDNDTTGCMCVSGGVSDSDLSRGLSLAMTAGAHELDWGTTDWQASITYAMQVDEDEEGAYSGKIGKKWKEIPALFHVTFVPEQGQDYGNWVIMGGTIRW